MHVTFTSLFFALLVCMAGNSIISSNSADNGAKYTLMAEHYEEIDIEQGDVVGNLFLLPDDYTLNQKQRFLQYMLRYLTALRENKLEVQVHFFLFNHLSVKLSYPTNLYHEARSACSL